MGISMLNIFHKKKISPLAEKQLKYLVKKFREWKVQNYPELSDKEALKLYEGITVQELIENVK